MYIVHKTKSNNIQGNNHFTKEQHINCCFSSRIFNNKPIYTLTTWSTLPPLLFQKKEEKKWSSTESYLCLLVHLDQCHHLASVVWCLLSVVCKLFTFQAFSPKPLGQLEPILAGMFVGWSSTKLLLFVPVGFSTWLPGPIICSDWLKFQRSSSLKLMNCLNPNCK